MTSTGRGAPPASWQADATGEEILRVEDLVVEVGSAGGRLSVSGTRVRPVDGVSFTLAAGEVLGLVGESGCGKTTTARAVLRLQTPVSGRIRYRGRDVTRCSRRQLRTVRREVQAVFQDPYASLDPRLRIGRIVAEPLRVNGVRRGEVRERVAEVLELVGLRADDARRHPHELSGGQRQRVAIARAIAPEPRLLVLDEPLSSLDVCIQAEVLAVLRAVRERLGLACLFITHDLAVARHFCDRLAVMYLGKLVEVGERRAVLERPQHPYTRALVSAVPQPDPRGRDRPRIILSGDLPSLIRPPTGCRFHTRCWAADERCTTEDPPLADHAGDGRLVACLRLDVLARTPVPGGTPAGGGA